MRTLSALLILGLIVGANRADAQAPLEHVRNLVIMADYESAMDAGKAALQRDSTNRELRAWYLIGMMGNGYRDEAVTLADAFVRRYPADPWANMALAAALGGTDRADSIPAISARAFAGARTNRYMVWARSDALLSRPLAARAFLDSLPPSLQADPLIQTARGRVLLRIARSLDAPEAKEAFELFATLRARDSLDVNAWAMPGTRLRQQRSAVDAYPLLKRAAALGTVPSTHLEFWAAILGRTDITDEQRRAEIEAGIADLYRRRGETPAALYQAQDIYGELKLDSLKRVTEETILARFPDSYHADAVLVYRQRALRSRYYEAQKTGVDTAILRDSLHRSLVAFVGRSHVWNSAIGESYLTLFQLEKDNQRFSGDSLLWTVKGMEAHERINPHITYAGGAIALAERKTGLDYARQLAQNGMAAGTKQTQRLRDGGLFETQGDYEKSLNYQLGLMHDALGWVFFNDGKLEDAEAELLTAYDLNHTNPENLNRIGRFYEAGLDRARQAGDTAAARSNADKAETFYIKGKMAARPGVNPNDASLKALYEKRRGSLDGYEAYLAGAAELDRGRRHREILANRVAQPSTIPPFTLRTLAGDSVSSSSLTGKIVVVNFWGTWCGPCVAELPEFQKFADNIKGDPEVVLLTINNDIKPSEVVEWMKKRKYDFPVLLDNGYGARSGVTSFPTTWFFGKDGKMVYAKKGWSDVVTEEFGWRIDALKEKAAGPGKPRTE